MKGRITDYGGALRIEVTPENNDERMLFSAFLREHNGEFGELLEIDGSMPLLTFGRKSKEKP